MTQKKKAELQRKLSMAPVTRPPGDLLDRLKNDIPDDLLSTQRDRERASRSMAFSLRVAAAIVLMITSTFALVQFLSRSRPETQVAKSAAAPPPQSEVPRMAELTVTLADARKDEVQSKPVAQSRRKVAMAKQNEENKGVVVGAVADMVAAAPPPPAAEPTVVAAGERSEANVVTAEAPAITSAAAPASGMMRQSRAADLSFAAPRTIFGISVDSAEFGRLKDLIEKGQTPEADEVNIDALVNHFAGASPPRRNVRLQVEGSRAPLAGARLVLRYTIDTEQTSRRGALPIVASNARLDIELNSKAVLDYKLLADEGSMSSTEQTLMMNLSATGLIEIHLRPGVRPRERVATVRLRYRSVADGRTQMLTKTVEAQELQRTWISASRRHRLATLGAVWGESLKGKATASDVARRAEELATEAPSEPLARDLARAASASSRLQTSGPTGSGQ